MNWFKRSTMLSIIVWGEFTNLAGAGAPCVVRHVAAPTLTIVPFAVPVAVPVATVSYPSVLYGVRESVTYPPATSHFEPASLPSASQQDAVTILTRHCAVCHGVLNPQGEQTFFQADGRLLDKLPRHLMLDAVSGNAPSMPPAGRAKLSPAEIQVIRAWATLPRNLTY